MVNERNWHHFSIAIWVAFIFCGTSKPFWQTSKLLSLLVPLSSKIVLPLITVCIV